MTTVNTRPPARNGHGEWEQATSVSLSPELILTMTTSRNFNRQLMTICAVWKRCAVADLMVSSYDFVRRTSHGTPSRVTTKTVEAAHADALATLPAVLAEARQFYKLDAAPQPTPMP